METITIYPNNTSQLQAIKAMVKAFNLDYKIDKEKPYNPEFVAKILDSEKQIKEGKTKRVKKEDLKQYLGL